MEDLIKRIDLIITNFSTGEVGKSLFSIIALREMILTEVRNYKPVNIKSEVKKEDVKK